MQRDETNYADSHFSYTWETDNNDNLKIWPPSIAQEREISVGIHMASKSKKQNTELRDNHKVLF